MLSPQILVVEDSAVTRRALTKRLKDYGAEVTQAEDGQQGLEMAIAGKFDLIISDVEMPRLNGLELCRKLKENPATRAIPVVIMSSLDGDNEIDRGFQAGAAAYISKTDAPSQLSEVIDRILKKAAFQRERTVLVVDDSFTIRKLVEKGLSEAGFQVVSAKNGKEALEVMRGRKPDLILSDIDMPEMNGVEFCKAAHADPDLVLIPFVIMSANSQRAMVRRMLQRGVAAYLVKPFNLEQLVATIEKLLSDQFLLLLKERERLETERKMMLAGITSLIQALEARDSYTRGHSEAVSTIVVGMAGVMQMGPDEIETLALGARLHDLGKIGVRDNVLLKEGGLTDEEYALIQMHPVIGAGILRPIPTLRDIVPIVLYHHERIDGKGYPEKLQGDQIPLWARMTAVGDTYHALTSDRPYRKGMPLEKALKIMDDMRGKHLCPDSVDVFYQWLSNSQAAERNSAAPELVTAEAQSR
ncbi:MAG: response regulator [Nitrospinae bacterium]|nr:response regulator [Nitrospinota bacterium]